MAQGCEATLAAYPGGLPRAAYPGRLSPRAGIPKRRNPDESSGFRVWGDEFESDDERITVALLSSFPSPFLGFAGLLFRFTSSPFRFTADLFFELPVLFG